MKNLICKKLVKNYCDDDVTFLFNSFTNSINKKDEFVSGDVINLNIANNSFWRAINNFLPASLGFTFDLLFFYKIMFKLPKNH